MFYGLIIGFLAIGVSSLAEAKGTLDLNHAIRLAIKSSDQLKSRREALNAAQYDWDKSKASRLPTLDLTANYSKFISPSTTTAIIWNPSLGQAVPGEVAIKKDYGLEAALTMKQVLWTFGKVQSAIDASRQAVSLQNFDYRNTENQLRYDVTRGFLGVILAKKTQSILRQSLNNAKDNNKIFTDRFKRGRAPQSDRLRLDRDIQSRQPNVDQAKEQLGQAMANLKMLTGIPFEESVNVKAFWPKLGKLLPLKEARKRVIQQSTQLKLAGSNVALKKELVDLKKSALYPDLALFAQLNVTGQDDEASFSTENSLLQVGVVGVSLTVPIFSGGSQIYDVRKAESELRSARYTLHHAAKQTLLLLENLYLQWNSYNKQISSNEKLLEAAKSTFEMSQRRFKTGQTSIIELNDAELLLTQAKLQIQQSLFNKLSAQAQINQLLNKK